MIIYYTQKHLTPFQVLKVAKNKLNIYGNFEVLEIANCILFDYEKLHITYYKESGKIVSYTYNY